MRIAYDHGMGVNLIGSRQRAGQIMVIHVGEGARNYRQEKGLPTLEETEGGTIPGTDLTITASEDAKNRDAEVRSHERAHLLSAGSLAASGIQLVTRRGPDGESLAVGGSVKIDMSPIPGDPDATIRKARNIIQASMAPGDPSSADMRVAAEAYRMAAAARKDIRNTDIFA